MKFLYLDDVRTTPIGFDVRTFTAPETIERLKEGDITHCSLDHDLGGDLDLPDRITGDGYEVACWIEEQAALGTLNRIRCLVHSANPSGAAKMRVALNRADGYWDMWEFDPSI